MKVRIDALLLFFAGWLFFSTTGQAASQGANVVFIAIDDLNDWVGFLGGHPQVQTPHMDRLAQRGIVFANAQCAAPLCAPSRAALFSGKQPFHTGVYDNQDNVLRIEPRPVLLPEHFRNSGYITFGSGKMLHERAPELFDEHFFPEQRWSSFSPEAVRYLPEELPSEGKNPRHVIERGPAGRTFVLPMNGIPSDRGPDTPSGESFDWGPVDVPDSAMGDGQIAEWAIGQLRRSHEKPFFLGVGFYRPHIPLFAPQKYFDLYPENSILLPEVLENDLADLTDLGRKWALEAVTAGRHATVLKYGQWKRAVAAYLACISFVDVQIGKIVEALEAGRYADNTAVVLWSDHGWHLGEKGRVHHAARFTTAVTGQN